MNVENQVRVGIEYRDGESWDSSSAALRRAHPFDRLRMTLSGVEWVSAPSRFDRLKAPSLSRGKVEGLALAATLLLNPL